MEPETNALVSRSLTFQSNEVLSNSFTVLDHPREISRKQRQHLPDNVHLRCVDYQQYGYCLRHQSNSLREMMSIAAPPCTTRTIPTV